MTPVEDANARYKDILREMASSAGSVQEAVGDFRAEWGTRLEALLRNKSANPHTAAAFRRVMASVEVSEYSQSPARCVQMIKDASLLGLWEENMPTTIAAYPVRNWQDCGLPVFELAKHAAHELVLTRKCPLHLMQLPASAFFIRLPTEDTLRVLNPYHRIDSAADFTLDVFSIFVFRVRDMSEWGSRPCVWAWSRDGQFVSAVLRAEDEDADYNSAVTALVSNFCAAVTCRQDDIVCETLEVRKMSALRPSIRRVRMRNPRVDLAPHVKRFVLEGERAFSSKRGHHVLGFFRRPPGGDTKTVWVRPHFRGGKLGEATEPRVIDVVKGDNQ